jgi:hypothetical protein
MVLATLTIILATDMVPGVNNLVPLAAVLSSLQVLLLGLCNMRDQTQFSIFNFNDLLAVLNQTTTVHFCQIDHLQFPLELYHNTYNCFLNTKISKNTMQVYHIYYYSSSISTQYILYHPRRFIIFRYCILHTVYAVRCRVLHTVSPLYIYSQTFFQSSFSFSFEDSSSKLAVTFLCYPSRTTTIYDDIAIILLKNNHYRCYKYLQFSYHLSAHIFQTSRFFNNSVSVPTTVNSILRLPTASPLPLSTRRPPQQSSVVTPLVTSGEQKSVLELLTCHTSLESANTPLVFSHLPTVSGPAAHEGESQYVDTTESQLFHPIPTTYWRSFLFRPRSQQAKPADVDLLAQLLAPHGLTSISRPHGIRPTLLAFEPHVEPFGAPLMLLCGIQLVLRSLVAQVETPFERLVCHLLRGPSGLLSFPSRVRSSSTKIVEPVLPIISAAPPAALGSATATQLLVREVSHVSAASVESSVVPSVSAAQPAALGFDRSAHAKLLVNVAADSRLPVLDCQSPCGPSGLLYSGPRAVLSDVPLVRPCLKPGDQLSRQLDFETCIEPSGTPSILICSTQFTPSSRGRSRYSSSSSPVTRLLWLLLRRLYALPWRLRYHHQLYES